MAITNARCITCGTTWYGNGKSVPEDAGWLYRPWEGETEWGWLCEGCGPRPEEPAVYAVEYAAIDAAALAEAYDLETLERFNELFRRLSNERRIDIALTEHVILAHAFIGLAVRVPLTKGWGSTLPCARGIPMNYEAL